MKHNNTMKQTFIVTIENKGLKNNYKGTIRIVTEQGILYVGGFEYPKKMHRGDRAETIAALVKQNELPKECLNEDGYPNYDLVETLAKVCIVQGDTIHFSTC